MHAQAAALVKRTVPKGVFYRLKQARAFLTVRSAGRAILHAQPVPSYLSLSEFDKVFERYPLPPNLPYTPRATAERGQKKASFLRQYVPSGGTSLELGCWDGMTSGHLAASGVKAYGIDIRDAGFDERAIKMGAKLAAADAANLVNFHSDSFDLIYTYDSFEHFHDPAAVLSEAIRVAKPGGLIYVRFGPLYNSAYGLHAYRSIPVPFCQVLLRREQIEAFTKQRGLPSINFDQLNFWTLAKFRDLWKSNQASLRPKYYYEGHDHHGTELMDEFPSCFRAKYMDMDEFFISNIEACFEVRK